MVAGCSCSSFTEDEQIASSPRPQAVAPSAIPSRRFKTELHGLREDEVDELVVGYACAAALAAAGGFDGIEISSVHNYRRGRSRGSGPGHRRGCDWGRTASPAPARRRAGACGLEVLAGAAVERERTVVADWSATHRVSGVTNMLAAWGFRVFITLAAFAAPGSIYQ